jgi:hypothetical protein
MNIQPLKSHVVQAPAKPKAQPAKPAAQPESPEAPKAGKYDKLKAALQQEPGVRAEEVARGKALVADPGYPSDEVLAKIAERFLNSNAR